MHVFIHTCKYIQIYTLYTLCRYNAYTHIQIHIYTHTNIYNKGNDSEQTRETYMCVFISIVCFIHVVVSFKRLGVSSAFKVNKASQQTNNSKEDPLKHTKPYLICNPTYQEILYANFQRISSSFLFLSCFFRLPKSNTGSGAKVNHIPLKEDPLKSDCQVLGESCKYVSKF